MTTKQLSAAAQAVSADLQAAINLDDKHQDKVDSSIYYKHGETAGYSKENLDGVKKYDQTFMAGLMDATAVVGLKAQIGKSELVKVEVTAGGAKGEEFSAVYVPKTEGVIPARNGEPEKQYVSMGKVRGSHKTTSSGKSGDLGIAQALAVEAATAALVTAK